MAKRESGGDFFPDSARNFVQFAGVPMKAVGFPDRDLSPKMKKIVLSGLTTLTLLPSLTAAPALETLLPAETVAVVAVPDYAGAEKNFNAGAIGQLWNSKEMKAFREKFEDGFTDNVLGRIEKQYGIDVEAFEELAAGPVAFGLVAPSAAGQEPGALFLMDAGKKTFTLGRVISRLERDWKKTARKTSRTTIGKIKFTTLIGASERPVLHVGRDKGLFLAGSDAGLLEGVLARNNGKGEGALAANGVFAADNVAVLKGADAYIWANLSAVLPQLINNAPDGAELGINVGEMLSSLGVDGFQSIATTFREQEDGAYFDVFLGLPEAKRTGLLGLMETKKTDSAPPAFVPANVELFQRWRLDMAATWGNLEKLLTDTAPDVASMVEFTVGLLGKDKDQNFDFKKSFFENLGDDIIVFQQPPETKQLDTVGAGPVLVLVEATNPDELIKAIGEQLDVRGFVGHGAHPDVLAQAGAGEADMIIAVTLYDEVNMVACQVAHSLFNVPTKVARIRSQSYLQGRWQSLFSRDQMPIDVVISPEIEVGEMVLRRLALPGAVETVRFADDQVVAGLGIFTQHAGVIGVRDILREHVFHVAPRLSGGGGANRFGTGCGGLILNNH